MKKIINYLLAFIIPLAICIIFLYLKGVLNNVEAIYLSDLRTQHLPFLSYLKNIMLGRASIFYTFTAGLGNPMISTMIFYCISPINILLVLIDNISYAILFIYITKICLAGLTMYTLLSYKTKAHKFSAIVFSTCYAMSAFIINYFFCVFWFDSVYLAPLVLLGIDKIFDNEKYNLIYIFSLALAIICNIQMGFGLCVFSVVYFLYSFNIRYSLKKDFKKFKQIALIFIISSICAGAIGSGFLLAFIYDYSAITVARDIPVTTSTGVSNFMYVLKNLLTVGNLKTDYYNNFEPYVYCGLIVTFFYTLYIFNKDIDHKKRFNAILVLLFFVLSFSIRFLNLFWHLSDPILLNYRYSIYCGLFLTMIAYEGYITKEKLDKKDIIIMSSLVIIGIFMMILYTGEVYELYTLIYLLVIYFLIILSKNKSKKIEILLFIAVLFEVGLNSYLSLYTAKDLPYGQTGSLKSFEEIASWNDFEDGARVLYDFSYTDNTNDTLLLNKDSSVRYFSSVINGHLLNFFNHNLSTMGNNNYRLSKYDTPLMFSLMGNKYFYLSDDFNDNNLYQKVDSYSIDVYSFDDDKYITKNLSLYENPYALSMGYVVKGDVKYNKDMRIADYQNAIIKAFTGNDKDVMYPLQYHYDNADRKNCSNPNSLTCRLYTIDNPSNNPDIYIFTIFDTVYSQTNDKVFLDSNSIRPIILKSTSNPAQITIEYANYLVDDDFDVLTYNRDALIESLTELRKNMLTDIKINKNIMTAKLDTDKSGTLLLTIPYDKGFDIYVDGKKVSYYSMLDDAFVGLDITEGNHDIEVKYVDKKLPIYILMCVASLIITIVIYIILNKKINKKQAEEKLLEEKLIAQRLARRANKKEKKKKKK